LIKALRESSAQKINGLVTLHSNGLAQEFSAIGRKRTLRLASDRRLMGWSFPIFMHPDVDLGWSYRPGVVGWSSQENTVYLRMNRFDFRGPDWLQQPPRDTFRIAVIGDSFVESSNLPDEHSLTRQCQTTAWKAAGIKGAMSQAIRRGPHSARWRASSQSSPQCAREPCLRVPPARLLIRRPMSGSPQRAHRGFRVGPPGLAARDLLGALRFTGYVLTFDIGILGHAIARVARRIILHSAAPLGY
jgi:hypothetical protein